MTVNVEKFFNELLPAAMLKNPEYFKEIGFKSTLRITGEGGGEWCVTASNSEQSVTQSDLDYSNSISMMVEDFQQICQNPSSDNVLRLSFTGKLKTTGDPSPVHKLHKILNLGN